jgi:hypothetical protein
MSSGTSINCSPDANAPDDWGSGDQADSPVRQNQTGRWKKFCPDCGEWIGLGLKGAEWSFKMHRGGKRCRRIRQRKARETEELEQSFGVHATSAPPTSPIVQDASSSTTEPHPHFLSHESMHIKPPSTSLPPTTIAPVIRSPRLPCTGVRYKWELGNACKTYPFQYHETGTPTWFVGIGVPSPNEDIIELQSHECTRFRDSATEACLPCINVPRSREFRSVLQLASKDPAPTTPHTYLSWAQVERRLREANHEVRRTRREVE